MNSNSITKPSPVKLGSKLTTFLTESANFLGGMTRGTAHQVQHVTMWMKNLLRFVVASLAMLSFLAISNLFVLNLANAQAQSPSPSVNVALDANNSGTINVYSDTANLDDIEATATILKTKTHTLAIGAEETTNDDGTMSTPGTVATTSNSDAGFASNMHVTDLTLGSWYFAESDTTEVDHPSDTTIHTITRKVLFRPNLTNIKALTTASTRTSTLTITINDDSSSMVTSATFVVTIHFSPFPSQSVNVALDTNNSAEISAYSGTPTISDVAATATIFKTIAHTLEIEATETTTEGALPINEGTVSTTSNSDAGFASNQYVTDLTFGSWYFAETDTTNVASTNDMDKHTITRKVLFRPNLDAIKALPVNARRISTLTIKVLDGATSVTETTFEVSLDFGKPTLTIAAVTQTINEGDVAQFKVIANLDPGPNEIRVNYTPTETGTNFLDTTAGASGTARTVRLNFTKTSGQAEWTDTFTMNTRLDNIDGASGTISVAINPAAGNLKYLTPQSPTPAVITINDIEVPEISISAPIPPTNGNHQLQPGSNLLYRLSSNIPIQEEITVKFIPSTTAQNLLNTSSGLSGQVRTHRVRFNTSGGRHTATLPISTLNQGTRTGNIMVQLVGDNNSNKTYTLDTSNHSATARLLQLFVAVEMDGSSTRTIEITDPSVTYPNIPARISTLYNERSNLTRRLVVSKSVDGGQFNVTATDGVRGDRPNGTFPWEDTDYVSEFGTWHLPVITQNSGDGIGYQTAGVRFAPNSTAINNIPKNTVVKLELIQRMTGPQDFITIHFFSRNLKSDVNFEFIQLYS